MLAYQIAVIFLSIAVVGMAVALEGMRRR